MSHIIDRRFLGQLALLIGAITLFLVLLEIFAFRVTTPFFHVLFSNLMYTTSCTLFCTLLLTGFYERIYSLGRVLFFILFFIIVFAGIYAGMTVGQLILSGPLMILTARSLILPFTLGLFASIIMSGYTTIRHHLDEKIAKLKTAAQENEHLKRLESEARLTSLQAKLNPHFLFNTLNSLAALVYDDPQKAENGIIKLSEVYRHVLSISQRTFVPLQEEIRLIQDYLDLEKMRFDDQLRFSVTGEESLLQIKIPGLLIEPLIGNVIKHSLSLTDKPVTITVTVSKLSENIQIEVTDDGPGCDTEKMIFGYGLVSVQERLQMVYPDKHRFQVSSAPDKGFTVTITIPRFNDNITSNRGDA